MYCTSWDKTLHMQSLPLRSVICGPSDLSSFDGHTSQDPVRCPDETRVCLQSCCSSDGQQWVECPWTKAWREKGVADVPVPLPPHLLQGRGGVSFPWSVDLHLNYLLQSSCQKGAAIFARLVGGGREKRGEKKEERF